MSARITRPRFRRSLNDARCELAEARARAAASLAKMHREDGTWLGWLAKEHYTICLEKWAEYLRASGEERSVARYEFLINLKIWLQLLPMPVAFERDSYRKGNLYIAGFFGEDAFVVSQIRAGKRYRMLSDSQRLRRNDPYLRYPGSERFILPDGDDVGIIDTADSTRDRMVCLHDAFVLLAVTKGDSFRFRFVGANEKYPIYPRALEKDLNNYVGMSELIERIKREIKAYGAEPDKEEESRVDDALCAPVSGTSILYKPKEGSKATVSINAMNTGLLDEVDPTAAAPSLTRRITKEELADTEHVGAKKDKKDTDRREAKAKADERTTAKRAQITDGKVDTSGGIKADTSKHGSRRITSRKVVTNALSRADLEARRDGSAKPKRKRSLTAFFEGVLDDVDPLAERPQIRKEVKGETEMRTEADMLAGEFMEGPKSEPVEAPEATGPDKDSNSNRVISNFSRRTNSTRGSKRTRRPSGEVTTAVVRSKVNERNRNEYNSALLRLQDELDSFFDDTDALDMTIKTGLHSGRSATEVLRMEGFDYE